MALAILAVIFTFGLLIFFHELGHFISAKKSGVKVERFSFGLGPELLGVNVGETRYSICVVPFGGYVKLAGESVEEYSGQDFEYFHKPWYQKIFICLAGSFMNYILAFVIFFILITVWGMVKVSNEPIIGDVMDGFPAKKIGLRSNDKVVEINDKKVTTWQEIVKAIRNAEGEKIKIKYSRDNKIFEVYITPKYDPRIKRAIIGITPQVKKFRPLPFISLFEALKLTLFVPVQSIKIIFEKLLNLERPELAGPIGIAQIITKAAKTGISQLLYTIALISSMVGFFNLLPIPMLDGGHILLACIEGVTNKKPTKKLIRVSNTIGLMILLTLFSLALHDDLIRLIKK